jgi:hypothetical protein
MAAMQMRFKVIIFKNHNDMLHVSEFRKHGTKNALVKGVGKILPNLTISSTDNGVEVRLFGIRT